MLSLFIFFFNDTATTEIYTLSLHDALPILLDRADARTHRALDGLGRVRVCHHRPLEVGRGPHDLVELVLGEVRMHRSEEHTSELQSLAYLVCRLLLEKKTRHTRPRRWRAWA